MGRTNYEKINKTDINLTRFIFNLCSSYEMVLKLHGQAKLFKKNTQKYFYDLKTI